MRLKNIAFACAVLMAAGFCANALAAKDNPAPALSSAPAAAPAQERITAGQAAILGVVEGLTEYLPVSSTGHLILAGHFMGMTRYTEESGPFGRMLDKDRMKALDSFEIVIQLGAILAVLGLYRKRVAQMLQGLGQAATGLIARAGRDSTAVPGLGMTPYGQGGLRLVGLLLVAFLPAAIVGKLCHQRIEENLFGPIPVMIALAAGGVLMIVVEYFFWLRKRGAQQVTQVDAVRFSQALIIGLAQVLAMWPGTSRSMITILAGLAVGLDMVAAAEFSFLLALPTLGAATLYSAYKDWAALQAGAGVEGLLIGLVVSAVVAALAVKWFVSWLTRHGMIPFGVYRIALAIVLYLLIL
ncbi:MAG: undecaprenyl-diphosphate phosphatase [Phycisphaerae bacterium]